MRNLLPIAALLAPLTVPLTAAAHPLDACNPLRAATTYDTSVLFQCPAATIGYKKFREGISQDAVTDDYGKLVAATAEAGGGTVTTASAELQIGGKTRSVKAFELAGVSVPTGIVMTSIAYKSGVLLLDCVTAETANPTGCELPLDALATEGLPAGVSLLPFADQVKRATVLDTPVKVVIGCKADFVTDIAISAACSDAVLLWGDKAAFAGPEADVFSALKEEIRARSEAAESERACSIGGHDATCWTGTGTDERFLRSVTHFAELTAGGTEAVFVCTYTKVGDAVHPLCEQLLTFK